MKLYAHQKTILDLNPSRYLLALGTGTGKTRTALLLAQKNGTRALVICPKTVKEAKTWENECIKLHINPSLITVLSRETFRRDWESIPTHDTLILDESHTMMGVLPIFRQRKKVLIPKRSQICEAIMDWNATHKPRNVYLATATPERTPMLIWSYATLLGKNWKFEEFRDAFYVKLNMPGREVWTPKKDSVTKERLGMLIRSLGSAVRLEDCFDVPEQSFKTEYLPITPQMKEDIAETKLEYPDPIVHFLKAHQIENGDSKHDRISEYASEFNKLLIFAKYTEQIMALTAMLRKQGYDVLVLTGDTKNREQFFIDANSKTKCIVVAQASISAGYELPSFPCVIFASLSWSWVDHTQALGRVQRANALKKNLYVYIISKGGVDEHAYNTVIGKTDFSLAKYSA